MSSKKDKCNSTLVTGKRSGELCGRKIPNGKEMCHYHMRSLVIKPPSILETATPTETATPIETTPIETTTPTKTTTPIETTSKEIDTLVEQKGENLGDCCICFDKNDTKSVTLKCKHTFHDECLIFLNKDSCPLCRAKLIGLSDITKSIIDSRVNNLKQIQELEELVKTHQIEYFKLRAELQTTKLMLNLARNFLADMSGIY